MVFLENAKRSIEETLATLLSAHAHLPSPLYEGAKHVVLAPGKRIRPLLTLATVEMLHKASVESALVPACALELVHTYSLIHDDLPCMDDDDFRRGLPTLHRLYSEGHAVLVGDYLLTYAFEVLSTAQHLSPTQKIDLIKILATAGGGEGMIGGQVMDIEHSSQVDLMHARKTAALFRAAVEFGGIIAQASPKIMTHLSAFGNQFGKLFQMVDDLLDGDHPLGQVHAQEAARIHCEAALKTLESLPGETSALKTLTHLICANCLGNQEVAK